MKHLCRPGSKRLESTLFPGAAMAQLLRRALSVVSRLSQDSAPMEEQRSKVTVAHMRFVRKCIPVYFFFMQMLNYSGSVGLLGLN
jgi:hypothetical protein